MINVSHVKAQIGGRASEFVRALFGDLAKPHGDQWRIGTRGSLVVELKAGEVVWCNHEAGTGGDAISLWQQVRGGSGGDALKGCAAWVGDSARYTPPPQRLVVTKRIIQPIELPSDATPGTEADWQELAELRKLPSALAPATAALQLGTLWFAKVCGHRSWILTDNKRFCAEARRMDGEKYSGTDQLPERKAHTLRGSTKSWPVGLAVNGFKLRDFRALLCVEGMPDYLAALAFSLAAGADCLPVAILGAGVKLHENSLTYFAGMRVRFYPDADTSGAGEQAVERWASQLQTVGAKVDSFSVEGLRKADGSLVKDLNDCTSIHPEDAAELEEVLP